MLSNEWTDDDKLYRVVQDQRDHLRFTSLEVQHVPGVSEWVPLAGNETDTTILISRLRYLAPGLHGTTCWTYMGGRGASTRTLARLTASSTSYETSTDDGASWRETSHPFALAARVLELDPDIGPKAT